ncbi:uncharacterized protein LOC116352038 isoform X2 [Contarinia nasturtii]|nr:uncharacterized protein LOC116352038 isoform X2 [Contarinia nasturtii]
MQKPEKRHESRLKNFWRSPKTTSTSDESTGAESPTHLKGQKLQQLQLSPVHNKPACSLPLLTIWPSQDSPNNVRGEADGQSYVFGSYVDESIENERRDSSFSDHMHRDSGIDSSQASPSPNTVTYPRSPSGSPTPSLNNGNKPRRPSSALLHPDHARLLPILSRSPNSPDQSSTEDLTEYRAELNQQFYLASPSITSSTTSIAGSSKSHRYCDAWLQQEKDPNQRRRSSTMTNRYSLFDALDLECALLRAAARGSVGPYSLSESLHKLTFTQSLAFPALARGLATKQRRTGQQSSSNRPSNSHESLLNTFAKVITALVLFVVSILVFLIVYKFVRT